MTKWRMLALLLLICLTFAGCFDAMHSEVKPPTETVQENLWADEWNHMKEDFEDLRQEIQIYSADGELLLTLTENEDIFIFIKHKELDQWDYSLREIPPDAMKLCTLVDRAEQNGQMVTEAVETMYYDADGYYHLSEAPGASAQNKMTDTAARYLIELVELPLTETQPFSAHEFYAFFAEEEADAATDESVPPFVGLTYEGMIAASRENLIEIQRDGDIVRSISDNQEVFDFLVSLQSADWESAESIPSSAVEVCSIVRYQLGRRELAGQMTEQSRLVLYQDGENSYIDVQVADNGTGEGDRFNALYPQRFRVPAEIGDLLLA